MRRIMKFDFSDFNQSIANSATKIAEINHQHEESLLAAAQANQKRIEREERMVAGAEANIAQKELLEQFMFVVVNKRLFDQRTQMFLVTRNF